MPHCTARRPSGRRPWSSGCWPAGAPSKPPTTNARPPCARPRRDLRGLGGGGEPVLLEAGVGREVGVDEEQVARRRRDRRPLQAVGEAALPLRVAQRAGLPYGIAAEDGDAHPIAEQRRKDT